MTTNFILDYEPPAAARVRIISDLHYGHKKSTAPAPAELIASMQGVDLLVLAGDTAETREGPFQQEGEARLQELRSCCEKAGIHLITLAGNHDPEQGPQMLRLWQGRCVVIHGHQLFEEIAPWGREYICNKAVYQAMIAQFPRCHEDLTQRLLLAQELSSYRIQHLVHYPHKTGLGFIDHLLHCFWPPERPYNIVKAWLTAGKKAQKFARTFAPQAQIIAFGHVHRHGQWRKGDLRLFTTGAWFQHAKPYYLDLQDGQVIHYHQIKK